MRSIPLVALLAAACATPPPYTCSTPIDPTGRGLALCHDATQTPVCDAVGAMAHYELNAVGVQVLVGGTTALCDSDDQVVCSDRTVSPHCLTEPPSH